VPTVHLVELTFDDDKPISIGAIAALYADRPLLGARLVQAAPPPTEAPARPRRPTTIVHPFQLGLLAALPNPGDVAKREDLIMAAKPSEQSFAQAQKNGVGHVAHLVEKGYFERAGFGLYRRLPLPAEAEAPPPPAASSRYDPRPTHPTQFALLATLPNAGDGAKREDMFRAMGLDKADEKGHKNVTSHLARLVKKGFLTNPGFGFYRRTSLSVEPGRRKKG
jgi:hypothetical protein